MTYGRRRAKYPITSQRCGLLFWQFNGRLLTDVALEARSLGTSRLEERDDHSILRSRLNADLRYCMVCESPRLRLIAVSLLSDCRIAFSRFSNCNNQANHYHECLCRLTLQKGDISFQMFYELLKDIICFYLADKRTQIKLAVWYNWITRSTPGRGVGFKLCITCN